MEQIPLPSKVEVSDTKDPNKAEVSIQPCFPGYGTTIGNSLRRVLLSSLPGGAVIAFKLKGASHEFSTIEGVKEDLVEITLNLKKLRLNVHSEEPIRLELKASGAKKVTGKDIKANADVDVVNKSLVIANLTDKNAEFEMEILVAQGRGYVPTENHDKENLEVDMISIDSIFTPMRNVGFRVEDVRVGKITNFENLILEIETDGSISPKEAVGQATQILLDHFNFISEETAVEDKPKKKTATKKKAKKEETDLSVTNGEPEPETEPEAESEAEPEAEKKEEE